MTSGTNRDQAKMQVLRWLRHGEISRARAEARLQEKGFDTVVIDGVLGELVETGILDDARCAESLVNAWCRSGPMAARELERRLVERGIDSELAVSASMAACNVDELEDALSLARKRLGRLGNLPRNVAARRLFEYLARRGYEEDTACRTLDALGLSIEED